MMNLLDFKMFENREAEMTRLESEKADLDKLLPSIQAKIPKRYKNKKAEAAVLIRKPSDFPDDWSYIISIRCKLTPKKTATFARVYGPDYWEMTDWENHWDGTDFTMMQEEIIKAFDLVRRPDYKTENPNAFTQKEFEERIKTQMLSKKFGLDR